jgi:hypothetical protein
LEEIKRIWSIRCALDHEDVGNDIYEYIANGLYRILVTINPNIKERIHEIIHKGLVNQIYYGYDKDAPAIEKLVYIYRSQIMSTTYKEKVGDEYVNIFDMPEPQVDIFKRITSGNGKYEDYDLVVKLDKRLKAA